MHLLTSLQERYPLKFDWSPCQFLGIDIAFDKRKRTVKLSIFPRCYVALILKVGLATTPCIYVPPIKGIKAPQMVQEPLSPLLDDKGKTRIQEIVGVLLYYSRVIDSFIATAVNMLSEQIAAPTEDTNTSHPIG